MRSRLYQTDALILRRRDSGEADRLLLLATPHGKQHVIAKGVRKTTSRLAGHIELFTHTTLMLATGRHLDVVTQSLVVHAFDTMRHNLQRLGFAYYLAELYDGMTSNDETPQQFSLLLHAFAKLNSTQHPEQILRAYELHLLEYSGYKPQLHTCAVCQTLLTAEANRFSPVAGGVVCPTHATNDNNLLPMSFRTFKVLRFFQKESFDVCEQVTISPPVLAEMAEILGGYIRFIRGVDLKTPLFLQTVQTHKW